MKSVMKWVRLDEFPDAKPPERAHVTDSGVDMFAAEDCTILPGQTVKVRTGICVRVFPYTGSEETYAGPTGYNQPGGWTFGCFGWDKSGLGSKGLKVGAGVIDNPYTGEIVFVITYLPTWLLWNQLIGFLKNLRYLSQVGNAMQVCGYEFKKGDKIAQLVVQRVELSKLEESVDGLGDTDRGASGFGDSGK